MADLPRALIPTLPVAHASGPGELLPEPDPLFDLAFDQARAGKLDQANQALAVALVAQARASSEGRLSASLNLLARLVAEANPEDTLGARGASVRARVMPNGWRHMAKSWSRLRYAWREGLPKLLGVDAQAIRFGAARSAEARNALAETLDEITRLNASDPEPVAVKIQGEASGPDVSTLLGVAGFGITIYSFWAARRQNEKIDRVLRSRSRKR